MAITISGENNNDRITAQDGVIDTISGFNIAGIITASSFTGDLTGDVTGDLTGNVTGNVNNTSNLLLQVGGTERLRLNSDRVIIGVSNSNNQPTYNASTTFATVYTNNPGAFNAIAIVGGHTTGAAFVKFGDRDNERQGQIGYYNEDDSMRFFVNGNTTEKIRIMSGGSIGIRTTTGNNTVNIGGAQGLGVKFHNFTSGNSTYFTVESGDKLQSNVGGSGYYTWVTGGTEKMRLDNVGRLGIGTDNPTKTLQVMGTILKTRSDSGIGLIYLQHDASQNGQIVVNNSGGTTKVKLNSAGDSYFNGGRIGLGIDNPGDYFSSYNRVVMGRTNDTGGMTIVSASTSGGYISFADGTSGNQAYRGLITYAHSDDSMRFGTDGGTERLRITSKGIIQIGGVTANSADIDSYNTKLTIKQSANNKEDGIYIERSGERRGHYIYVGGAHNQSDALCISTNQLGGDTDLLAIDRGGNVIIKPGNVGIGYESPVTELDVRGSSDASITIGLTDGTKYGNFSCDNSATYLYAYNGNDIIFSTHSGNSFNRKVTIKNDGKFGIGEASPENQLHISGTTGSSAGGLLRLDATTGDNFIIFDNTGDNSEWVIGNDAGSNDEFRMYYNSGSGYGKEIINIDGTTNNGKVIIDGGTTTSVIIRADSAGTASLRLGGQSGSGTDQCTGFVEVHQDESHGGGMFYNGDGSPSFATGEAADYFSLYRFSSGTRHSVMRWFHSSNQCEVQGDMLIDNGTSTIVRVQGDSAGTAGISCGGSGSSDNQTQCTGYLECHQDRIHGGGIAYNGDGSPGFVNNESADHITFYRMNNGTRERVFHYPYNSNAVNFRGGISAASKSFRISHPHPSKKDTHDLIHSSIEGPQCDNIYRGKVDLVDGTATVNIDTVSNMTDGTFVLLNRDIQCFTSNETGWTNVKGSVTGNLLTIIAQDNTCTDTISWMVVGERQDEGVKSEDVETTDSDGKLIVELLKEA